MSNELPSVIVQFIIQPLESFDNLYSVVITQSDGGYKCYFTKKQLVLLAKEIKKVIKENP